MHGGVAKLSLFEYEWRENISNIQKKILNKLVQYKSIRLVKYANISCKLRQHTPPAVS